MESQILLRLSVIERNEERIQLLYSHRSYYKQHLFSWAHTTMSDFFIPVFGPVQCLSRLRKFLDLLASPTEEAVPCLPLCTPLESRQSPAISCSGLLESRPPQPQLRSWGHWQGCQRHILDPSTQLRMDPAFKNDLFKEGNLTLFFQAPQICKQLKTGGT